MDWIYIRRYERISITSLRNEVNWLTANSRRKYFKLVLVHSLVSTGRPSYISSQFKPDETIRRSQRNLADNSLSDFLPLYFALPTSYGAEFYKNSFFVSAITEWNNLPLLVFNEILIASTKNTCPSIVLNFLYISFC